MDNLTKTNDHFFPFVFFNGTYMGPFTENIYKIISNIKTIIYNQLQNILNLKFPNYINNKYQLKTMLNYYIK